ncbi:MAG: FtsH protease activity modulator HflK [Paracoccaceae bacterium]|nr:FtsH protease activity modulator HflK [Paracoccaceae bacterium]
MSNGGPWGTGGGDDEDRNRDKNRPGQRRPGEGAPIPEIEEFMKKGSEQLRVLMGGRGGGSGGQRPSGNLPSGPAFTGSTLGLIALAAAGLWAYASFYTVQPNERSVELMFGKYSATGNPGLNFAAWPVVTAEVIPVTDERTTELGAGRTGPMDNGLMLTGDQNIVDIEFQVVWNIKNPTEYLFNLSDPQDTVRAVSESAMRDIIARSELAPILNRDRGMIASDLRDAVQKTLDTYNAGIQVIRVNFNRADPPREVIDSFREVQAAQQERDRLEKEADAYANQVTAGARGEAAQLKEQAEAYRAQVVNNAEGEAARFTSVYNEYVKAPDVTKRRMFMETMGKVLGSVDKVILDSQEGGSGVVPYLPLDQLRKPATATTGGNN